MVTNLLRPWILARLLTGGAAAILLVVATLTAWRVLRHWRVGATTEGQIALERRAELVATVVQAALAMTIGGLVLTVLGADRTAPAIRGAMCAYGVFASTDGGFLALATSALASFACAMWLVVHRLDLRMPTPTLTRGKFLALFSVAPLVWLDLWVASRFALRLDLEVVASCCSSGLDSARQTIQGAGADGAYTPFLFAVGATAAAAGTAFWARRRPHHASAWTAAVASLVAAAASVPAILGYVAPHVYESPAHQCPFCLLHADVGAIGWPLFGALFAGTVVGAALGLVSALERRAGDASQSQALRRRLGGAGAIAWAIVLVLTVTPVLRFTLTTGGASLFGHG